MTRCPRRSTALTALGLAALLVAFASMGSRPAAAAAPPAATFNSNLLLAHSSSVAEHAQITRIKCQGALEVLSSANEIIVIGRNRAESGVRRRVVGIQIDRLLQSLTRLKVRSRMHRGHAVIVKALRRRVRFIRS